MRALLRPKAVHTQMWESSDILRCMSKRCFSTEYSAPGEEAGFSGQETDWTDAKPLTEAEKQALIQQIIRSNIISEVAASRLAAGQRCTERRRPDYAYRQEREEELLRKAEALVSEYRARPSLFRPLASAAGASLGAIASILPKQSAAAIAGGMQEALTEQYNDQLRELREAGASEEAESLRQTIREFRDEERAPPEAVQAPDLMKLQRMKELSSEEILAGVVKYGLKGIFALGSKV